MPRVELMTGEVIDLSQTNLWCPKDQEVSIICNKRGTPLYIFINGRKYRINEVKDHNLNIMGTDFEVVVSR